ncbi:MAG: universal stress protein [Halobacteriaceae archaeon]
MIETVVVATDGSESVARAERVALDLANRFDAVVHALCVVDAGEIESAPEDLADELRVALESQGEEATREVAERAGRSVTTAVRRGRPAVEIASYAREVDADVVATGTRGRHGENRFLIGSVAERVVRTCPVPVLTVRHLEGEGEVPLAGSTDPASS